MRSLVKFPLAYVMLLTSATAAWSDVGSVSVNVEAMIGEATIIEQTVDGKNATVVVTTGKTTRKDPATGQITLAPSSVPNAVNQVVQAIAGSAPDADNSLPTDDGCSQGEDPLRPVARPEYDEAIAATIARQLQDMSPGELVMVMAVLINNAGHLCIDPATVANTVALITTLRPEESGNVVFVAALLDPDNADRYTDAAMKAAPKQTGNIERARDDAKELGDDFSATLPPRTPGASPDRPPVNTTPPSNVPPGGAIGVPPSPE